MFMTPSEELAAREFLSQFLEQNNEVMGPKEQVYDRYANPADGTLISVELPRTSGLDDGERLLEAIRSRDINRVIPGYTDRRDAIRERIAPYLRGV